MVSYSELSDKELLELIAQEDQRAFDFLYTRYWERVLSLAIHKTGDLMEAENIVQDVFVSLWKRRSKLEIKGQFEHYLFISIKYRVIKLLNQRRSIRLLEQSRLQDLDLLDDSTQEYLAFDELSERLVVLINKLPIKSRLIYQLNKDQGKSYKEIAEVMDMTESAVDSNLVRTKRTLRASLGSFLSSIII